MKHIFVITFAFVLALVVAPITFATKPIQGGTSAKTPLGIDVSWPQCGQKLPTDHAFGIVGVTGGLANDTNPCAAEQLAWANRALGTTAQEKIQVYVNTANPGGLKTASWPRSNQDPTGATAPNPHQGVCDGSDSLACAWQYGWNRAVEDVTDRFEPAATAARIPSVASDYIWWLDVETENTWKAPGSTFNYQSNVAVLEGMTAYFKSREARVGLYSTAAQWKEITGNYISSDSNLVGLDNWRPGGASLNTAKQACTASPLTPQGRVVLTQFVSRGLDYNYSCI